MYALPLDADASDILARSAVCHPSAFADAMRAAAAAHRQAARSATFHGVAGIASRLAHACDEVADRLDGPMATADDAKAFAGWAISSGMDHWISALNAAGRLQCLPHAALSAACERTHDALFRAQDAG